MTNAEDHAHELKQLIVIVMAIVVLVTIVFGAFLVDEMLDGPAELACVQQIDSEAKDSWSGCDL